ncbi:SAP domain-containing protein [Histoplasma capsulatum]|uniref:SAP domain-containing protein n=1 Tax=Ajellomyces capsulatus TaxID=5037 RepID=A0A8A1MGM8_AJECA|nr:SAP domain-containing protein [Histoplasma capsulatum]
MPSPDRMLAAQQHAPLPSSALASVAPFRRSLHITGAFSAQPARGPDVTAIYRSRGLGDLRAECERRNLRSAGNKAELVDRLANHDILQSRAFSIAMRKIDNHLLGTGSSSRTFNTSRAQKSVNDSSTVDFVYMPQDMDAFSSPSAIAGTPMPTPPDAYAHYQLTNSTGTTPGPMKPQIYTVSGDYDAPSSSSGSRMGTAAGGAAAGGGGGGGGASAMSEVVDNQTVEFDPFELTETVRRAREGAAVAEQAAMADGTVKGVARQFWEGIVEDVVGKRERRGGVEGRK